MGTITDPLRPIISTHKALQPELKSFVGQNIILEPLSLTRAEELIPHFVGEENAHHWNHLAAGPFSSSQVEECRDLFRTFVESKEDIFWAVVCPKTSLAIGLLVLSDVHTSNRSIELGVVYSSKLQRTTGATEAVYLLCKYVFEDLKYRRIQWKGSTLNEPSKRAAVRFGFTPEGVLTVFRQHQIVKGRNRDTAWFSMLDDEWPSRKAAFEAWLAPNNFDGEGNQKKKLGELMDEHAVQTL
ncbi:putative GNAT family acetyltransferase [Flagelloscypha sp. PMI_526]|nr:putative GNAT family acetyltransferase [Flagelloscypha sp. PMI_526]